MPKVIPNARDAMILCTREALNEEGYANLSMRSVAKRCGVAPGTIYNYFHSKDEMVAACMLEDWKEAKKQMFLPAGQKSELREHFRKIYDSIVAFCKRNEKVIKDPLAESSFYGHIPTYHKIIVDSLVEIIDPLCREKAVDYCPELSVFIAENTIAYAVREASFDTFRRLIRPLFKSD